MIERTKKYLSFFALGLMATSSAQAESVPLYHHDVSFELGAYQLKSSKSSVSSVGSINLQYNYHFNEKWYASAAYQFIIQGSGSALVSGFDVGGHYCLFSCVTSQSELGGMVEVTEQSKLGLAVGAGFSARSFQLTSQSVGFSGPFAKITGNYYLGSKWKILTTAQILKLSNGPNALNAQILGLGLGMDF